MSNKADYPFAKLRPDLVDKIKRLETELAQELQEPVVLLAYEEPPSPQPNA